MNWIDKINEFGTANSGAFSMVSGIGGAASVVSLFATLEFQKGVTRSLEEIKKNLNEIKKNTEIIIQQNEKILRKLDQLPTRYEVRIMLREEVALGLLNRAYSDLHGAQNDINKHWKKNSSFWVNYRNSLQFIFDHDNELSHTLDLIAHCSFAFQITKGKATGFISNIITQKRDRLSLLREKLRKDLEARLVHLRESLLSNDEFVKSHNWTDETEDISEISFVMNPNRYLSIPGPCLVPYHPGKPCAEPGPPKRVLNKVYQENRNQFKKRIESKLEEAEDLISHLGEVESLVITLSDILHELN